MARIRTIKPEFHTSEQVMECSRDARLLFVSLWNFCDDRGVHPNNARTIKARVFPGDEDMDSATVRLLIDELSSNSLIKFYVVDDKEYILVLGWHHQKIDKPSYKYPAPPDDKTKLYSQPIDERSTNDRRMIDDESPAEGKGREGKGEEKKEGGANAQPEYAFVGQVVKLKPSDLAKWRESYHAIPDLTAEITAADAYYAENTPKDGKWFFPVSNWLKKAHNEALAKKAVDPDDEIYRAVI